MSIKPISNRAPAPTPAGGASAPASTAQRPPCPADVFESHDTGGTRRPADLDPRASRLAPPRDLGAEAAALRLTRALRPGDVNPSSFEQGRAYLQTFDPASKTFSYTPVEPGSVPQGSIVYVNGYNTSGAGAAASAQQVSQRNQNQPVYVVYNSTPWWRPGEIGNVNDNASTTRYPPVAAVKAILQQTKGNVTLMGHSMGQAITVAAAQQYGEAGGSLKNTFIYSWGGVANWKNQDRVAALGGHVTNFVHQQVDRVDAQGRKQTIQRGDAWAGANSAGYGGNNWAIKTIDAGGNATVRTNNSHTVGIDYWGGADPSRSSGHDYTGQIGNTHGMPLASLRSRSGGRPAPQAPAHRGIRQAA